MTPARSYMGRVRYYCAATLDGFIADPDDGLDWLLAYGDAEEADGDYEAFYEQTGALVMGSATYEWIVAHLDWPYAGKPTWVLSSRGLAPPAADDADVRILNARVSEIFDEIVESAGARDVWIVGGGDVASQFGDEDLIDTVEITVVPLVLGSGKPLFVRRLPGRPLELVASRALANGMVKLQYDVPAATQSA